jgi:hypothetical protein
MSLLEALLLDPSRIDIWVTRRTTNPALAGIQGTGTEVDPFSVFNATDFDSLMSDTSRVPNFSCVHLGPGVFDTNGYYDGLTGSGWQARPGIRLAGAGIGVSTLKLVNTTANKKIYAIGHDLSTSSTVDFFEVTDMTIDGGYSTLGATSSGGAVRILGSQSRAVRIKVQNWGSKAAFGSLSYLIAMLTGNGTVTPATTVTNSGMQDCIVLPPDAASTGTVSVLHVGSSETPGGTATPGVGCYIRNCYIDCGQNPLVDGNLHKAMRGLSMNWSKAGLIEGNQIHNTFYGGPHGTLSANDVVVRNNIYRNVAAAVLYQITTSGSMKLLIEGNQIELSTVVPLTPGPGSNPIGIIVYNDGVTAVKPYQSVILRSNRILYLDDAVPVSNPGSGAVVYGATNLLIRENFLNVTASNPLQNKFCTSVQYFENKKPSGGLIQGYRVDDGTTYTELATDADDAFILSLLLRK